MKSNTFVNNPDNRLLELFLSICIDLKRECLSDVARLAECSPSTVRNWRDGKTSAPRINTLMNVADALGYNIEWTRL